MATPAQYAAASAAILKIVQADIAKDVPAFFQSEIPQDIVKQFAVDAAKAAIDAYEGVKS
jgi:hypothetical protein